IALPEAGAILGSIYTEVRVVVFQIMTTGGGLPTTSAAHGVKDGQGKNECQYPRNEKSAQCWALSWSMMTGKNPMFLAPGLDLRPTEPEGYAGADNHQAGHDDHAELGLGHFTPPPR
ncbi:hypothetical protein, partial [Pseudomonas aeruginosa]|uniref:hypothetical protein n=4 Tax=Pseudomonas aeruginosa TaxID=287 RepID=UPI0019559BF0